MNQSQYPSALLQKAVTEISRLPGIGSKTALRLALHLLKQDVVEVDALADSILDYTSCHPYYSQQLASNIWQLGILEPENKDVFNAAIEYIVISHGLDYERLWVRFNKTNKWILQQLSTNRNLQTGEHRTSTIYSALKRLQIEGYVIYSDRYEIEDPFFKEWIKRGA